MRWETPSRPILACVAVCAFILVVATADLGHTESRVPDLHTFECQAGQSSCFNAQLSEGVAQERAAEPLQREFDSRAWLYVFAILAIAALATAWSMRTSPRTEWLRIFTNLGVIGVWAGIGVIVVLVATDGNAVTPSAAPLLMLPVVLLVAAAAGTLIGRSEGWAERSQADDVQGPGAASRQARDPHRDGGPGQAFPDGGAGPLAGQCGAGADRDHLRARARLRPGAAGVRGTGGPPHWTDPIDALTAVAAIGGMTAGIGALILRRWIAALISLVGCPVALLLVLVSTCAFS